MAGLPDAAIAYGALEAWECGYRIIAGWFNDAFVEWKIDARIAADPPPPGVTLDDCRRRLSNSLQGIRPFAPDLPPDDKLFPWVVGSVRSEGDKPSKSTGGIGMRDNPSCAWGSAEAVKNLVAVKSYWEEVCKDGNQKRGGWKAGEFRDYVVEPMESNARHWREWLGRFSESALSALRALAHEEACAPPGWEGPTTHEPLDTLENITGWLGRALASLRIMGEKGKREFWIEQVQETHRNAIRALDSLHPPAFRDGMPLPNPTTDPILAENQLQALVGKLRGMVGGEPGGTRDDLTVPNPPRARVVGDEKNIEARNALKGKPTGGGRWSARKLAKVIVCSVGLIPELPAWQSWLADNPKPTKTKRLPTSRVSAENAENFIADPNAISPAHDPELDRLIDESNADNASDPSPVGRLRKSRKS